MGSKHGSAWPRASRGRPRSEHARRAVLDATLALVQEGGYAAATIEEISTRSGVAKTTIYRWWPSRPALVVDLLMEMAAGVAPPPAGPNPLRALRMELSQVARAASALPGRLMLSLVAEAQNDPSVRAALRKGLFNPRRNATAEVVRRAQAAGQLRAGVPPLVAVDLLFGPVFYRRLLRDEPVTAWFVGQVFEHVMEGLEPGLQSSPKGTAKRQGTRPRRRRTPPTRR
jgi:AcrR family transcriptional regulator